MYREITAETLIGRSEALWYGAPRVRTTKICPAGAASSHRIGYLWHTLPVRAAALPAQAGTAV